MKSTKTNSGKNVKKENFNISDDELLNMNLDTLNLDKLKDLSKNINVKKDKKEKTKLYKNDLDKKGRMKIRRIRNKFVNNIIYYFQNNDEKSLKNEIKDFNEFYKKEYLLNDYSDLSIMQNNSDKDTKTKIKLFFEIIKRNK